MKNPKKKNKAIEVGCAIIVKDGEILVARRRLGDSYGGYWEFPGGKRERNETMKDCLRRECFEELGIYVHPKKFVCRVLHEYPKITVDLHFYICEWLRGKPVAKECHEFRWSELRDIMKLHYLPADIYVINELIKMENVYFKKRFYTLW